jgi:hypothetical protein
MTNDFLGFVFALLIAQLVFVWANTFYKTYLVVILIGFSFRLFIIFIHEQTNLFGDYDIVDYLPDLIEFNEIWNSDLLGYIKPHVPFYSVLYPGWLFNALGESGLWVIRVANAAIGVATIAPLMWLNEIIFGKKLTQSQALLLMLWPTWIRYTIEIGRTSVSVLAVLLSISSLLAILNFMKNSNHLQSYIYTILLIFFASFLRIHYFAYFIPILSQAALSQVSKLKISPYVRPILYFVSIVLIIVITSASLGIYQQLSQGNNSKDVLSSTEDTIAYIQLGELGGSLYLEGIYPRNPVDWIWYLPLQGFYFMFSPMPWDIRTGFAAGSSVQALIMFTLCFKALREGWKNIKNNQVLNLLLITVLFTTLAFGSVVKNAGSAERWRLPSTLILMMTTTSLLEISKKSKVVKHS